MRRRLALPAAFLLLAGVATAPPALAAVSPHCQEPGYCLFAGTEFTGVEVVVPPEPRSRCRPVSELGITTVRSAARGFADGLGLTLYSDTTCTTHAAGVVTEVPSTSARSYRLLPVPF